MKEDDYVLVLRNCRTDMTSREGFKYPRRGWVETKDWKPTYKCGNGLHGLLWGCGTTLYLYPEPAKWLVIKVKMQDCLFGKGDLDDKCKFKGGYIVYCGDRGGAIQYLDEHGAEDKPVIYANRVAGDYGTATAGNYGTATAGDFGKATTGYEGTATAGDFGKATAENCSTATAGCFGRATAGDFGTATAGDFGTATTGYKGKATAGCKGRIVIEYWDAEAERYRLAVGYIGENGLKPNVKYRLDEKHEFIEAGESKDD